MLYQAYQTQSDLLSPLRLLAQGVAAMFWLGNTEGSLLRRTAASMEVFSRMRLTHSRPAFGIDSVNLGEQAIAVTEHTVMLLPFGSLLHFRKEDDTLAGQPPVLLVAPLSGHFATLLRETTRTLLQDHDVYITDWHNARDVHLREGGFGLDDYIDHMMRYIRAIGPGTHVVAVCQPCVAALAATALMSEDDDPAQPRSLTLMAGPVDCRVNPTGVNMLATSKPIAWFEKNLISTVPLPHKGYKRRVYLSFVQLGAFSPGRGAQPGAQQSTDRIAQLHVGRDPVAEERARAPAGAIDDLIGRDQVARGDRLLQRTHGRDAEQMRDAELLEAVDVGPVVDLSGQQHVPRAVPGQKHHRERRPVRARQDPAGVGGRRATERCCDLDGRHALEHLDVVEARAANDAEHELAAGLGRGRVGRCGRHGREDSACDRADGAATRGEDSPPLRVFAVSLAGV